MQPWHPDRAFDYAARQKEQGYQYQYLHQL
jgi:hypothetical protein